MDKSKDIICQGKGSRYKVNTGIMGSSYLICFNYANLKNWHQ